MSIEITVKGEKLLLLPERAVYWPRTGTLFIADMHLSDETAMPDLLRLTGALMQTGAQQIIILGDIVDRGTGYSEMIRQLFTRWRPPDLKITLVRGDSEHHHGDPPQAWRVRCVDGPTLGPLFVLQHAPEPTQSPDAFSLAGQMHPTVAGDDGAQYPAFIIHDNIAIVPAYGTSVPGTVYTPQPGERVYMVVDHKLTPATRS
ncbi:MAG: metallophosphoesterase [Chloroflexota bacterium]